MRITRKGFRTDIKHLIMNRTNLARNLQMAWVDSKMIQKSRRQR